MDFTLPCMACGKPPYVLGDKSDKMHKTKTSQISLRGLWWGNVQKRFRSDNNSVKAARIKKIVYDIFKIEKLVPYPVIINV